MIPEEIAKPDGNEQMTEINRLAQAAWYVSLCRELHMPAAMQQRLLFCCGGCSRLWTADISYLFERLKRYPDDCHNCSYYHDCGELVSRERRFLNERIEECKTIWQEPARRDRASEQAARFVSRKVYPLDVTDSLYPNNLAQISSKPAILFCEGSKINYLNTTDLRITIVGTRKPTPYGLKVTELLADKLALYDCAIISGLASGIDACAHQTTLNAGGFTAAVTAGSTDVYYPYVNMNLQKEIADKCVVMSEQPPGTKPIKQFFPARNRILSGLADIVIVTESPKFSGTLITTAFAADYSREVFAVPGNILQQTSKGCNQLIIDGAELLDDIFQIVERFHLKKRIDLERTENRNNMTDEKQSMSADKKIDEDERRVMLALTACALNADKLANMLNMRIEILANILTGLELKNKIMCKNGRYFLTYE